jgi:hypothetical protein
MKPLFVLGGIIHSTFSKVIGSEWAKYICDDHCGCVLYSLPIFFIITLRVRSLREDLEAPKGILCGGLMKCNLALFRSCTEFLRTWVQRKAARHVKILKETEEILSKYMT